MMSDESEDNEDLTTIDNKDGKHCSYTVTLTSKNIDGGCDMPE